MAGTKNVSACKFEFDVVAANGPAVAANAGAAAAQLKAQRSVSQAFWASSRLMSGLFNF